jgi:hypothetical protein
MQLRLELSTAKEEFCDFQSPTIASCGQGKVNSELGRLSEPGLIEACRFMNQ